MEMTTDCKDFENVSLHEGNPADDVEFEFRLINPKKPNFGTQYRKPHYQERQGTGQPEPEEHFNPISNVLEYKGIYVNPTENDFNPRLMSHTCFSTFDGFSETVSKQPINSLEFYYTKFLTNPVAAAFTKLNLDALTELHLADVQISEQMSHLRLNNLRVLDLHLCNTSFLEEVIVNETNFENFLARFVSPSATWNEDLSTLLSWKLDKILLKIDYEKYLEVNHLIGKFHLAKLPFLKKVLDPSVKVQTLVLNCIGDFDLNKVNKHSLEVLSIQDDGVCDWDEIEESLADMTNLAEFYFYRKPFGKPMQVRLDGIPKSVKYLGLSKVAFLEAVPTQPMKLEHLILLEVSFPENMFPFFPKYFDPKRLVYRAMNSWSWRFDVRPTQIPNFDFLNGVVNFCQTEWMFFSVFKQDGSSAVEESMQEFLRTAFVPKFVADSFNPLNERPLIIEKRNNCWIRCETEEAFSNSKLMQKPEIFEEFVFGRNYDEIRIRNTLIFFDGFGPEVKKVRSIEMSGVIVHTNILRSELERIGTSTIEEVSFQDVTFFGPPLKIGEILFPNLKNFYSINSPPKILLQLESTWDDIKSQPWFRKNLDSAGNFELDDLWTVGVHVKVDELLEVCPFKKSIMTRLTDGNSLILKAEGLNSLTFISSSVDPLTIPLTLTFLAVDIPLSWEELMNQLANHESLTELNFGIKSPGMGKRKIVEIGQLPPNLELLKFFNADVTLKAIEHPSEIKRKTLRLLGFEFCNFPDYKFSEQILDAFGLEECTSPQQGNYYKTFKVRDELI